MAMNTEKEKPNNNIDDQQDNIQDEPKAKATSAKKKSKKEDKLKKELNELKEKNAELNDKFLRLYSEFDNYRKRTLKERTELLKSASEDVITQLLPVMDDFERGIKAFEDQGDSTCESLNEGIILIYNKFKAILTQKGVKPIEAIGHDFDVDYHEAVTNIPVTDEEMKGKVVDEIEKGYLLGDKVIRYSKVIVGQ